MVNDRLKSLIVSLDKHLYLSIIIGIIITAIMQSSSAVSVILIGLIEAGAISLKPAIGIMIGANIGTTVTGQILTFQLLSPSYCPGSGHSTHRYIWQEKNPFLYRE